MAKNAKRSKKSSKAVKPKRSLKSKSAKSAPKLPGWLVMFYGKDCPHSGGMMPLVDRLEKELGVKVVRLEVWNDKKNERLMMALSAKLTLACGGTLGVPSFYNTKTKEALCGEQSYENLRTWAAGR